MATDAAPATEPWRASVEATEARLGSDRRRGLAHDDAAERLGRLGPNELRAARREAPWRLLAHQFTNTMVLILLVAAVITFLQGDRTDTVVIGVIVVLNAAIGFVQEYRAEQAMEALHRMSATSAHVVRAGMPLDVPTAELVPGDLVRLGAGDVVPADLRLSSVADLRVSEAALTGESDLVDKQVQPPAGEGSFVGERHDMAFKGTAVVEGRGEGLVVATGMDTEIGRIASLLEDGRRATPLQRRLAVLGRRLATIALALCAIVFVSGVVRGEPASESFLTAVSLAVAAIPESLPAVVTVALALGARRMARRHALVRRLPAVETLGAVTVICTDKTGTLTENRMAVEAVWTPSGSFDVDGSGYEPNGAIDGPVHRRAEHLDRLARAAAACNDATLVTPVDGAQWSVVGDPTEGALLVLAHRVGAASGIPPRIDEVPFDATRRRMTTVHRTGEGHWTVCKGALDAVVPILRAGEPVEAAVDAADALAADGYRVLALAERHDGPAPGRDELDGGFDLLGLVGISDPLRPEAVEAVARCRQAGITTVMITGDHPRTARAIADRLGLLDEPGATVETGHELDDLDDDSLDERIDHIRVYARATPELKLRIVEAWQRRGGIVSMTGDGVNDAPALQRADIGVAMGITGTDVSREAADMVLADDDFSTIVHAVEEGRRIYDNLRRFVRYMLTSNTGEVLVVLLGPFLGLPTPLTAAQILWINLVTDGVPAVALGLEPAEPGTMRAEPRPPSESILARGLWQQALVVGAVMAAIVLPLQLVAEHRGLPWQTMGFVTIAFLQLGNALAVRSETRPIHSIALGSNRLLLGAILVSVVAQLMVVYVPFLQTAFDTEPLSLGQLLVVAVLSTGAMLAVEADKARLRRRAERRHGEVRT